jgi:predicted RNase H-like HicB family nuclease
MISLPPYSFRVFWSHEDGEFVATCVEIPGLSGLGASEAEAIEEVKQAIRVYVDYLDSKGLPPPQASSTAGYTVFISIDDNFRVTDFATPNASTESRSTGPQVDSAVSFEVRRSVSTSGVLVG